MIIFILIISYLLSIFLGRYLDVKIQIYKDPIHFNRHIMYGIWFIPLINIIIPVLYYFEYEIDFRRKDIKHNKFINWFFIGINYKTKESKQAGKELEEFWKNKHL